MSFFPKRGSNGVNAPNCNTDMREREKKKQRNYDYCLHIKFIAIYQYIYTSIAEKKKKKITSQKKNHITQSSLMHLIFR